MLGNMQSESRMNPGIWQGRKEGNMKGGFGLVQWTPATKVISWANEQGIPYNSMVAQLERICFEVDNPGKVSDYAWMKKSNNMTFKQFTQSTMSAYDLGIVFMLNYERPANKTEGNKNKRGNNANYWYQFFS